MVERLIDVSQTAAFGHSATSPQTLSLREISTCRIQLFLSNLQRFFKPSPSANSPGKSTEFTMRTHGFGHTREKTLSFWGALMARVVRRCRFSSVSENECR